MGKEHEVSVGVKISEDLIKASLAAQVAKTLGNAEDILAKVIGAVLDKKKDTYRGTPSYLEELVRESLKPIAAEVWQEYLKELEPEFRTLIKQRIKNKAPQEKLLESVDAALDKAFDELLKVQFVTKAY